MSRKTRVMVVDDELIVRESLGALLERDGAIADRAESGEQALDLLERNVYDVLFVDIQMPGMGGFGLLERAEESVPGYTGGDNYCVRNRRARD